MTHSDALLTEDEAIELFTLLITSARTQMDEPAQYASMRLLTAAGSLSDFVASRVSADAKEMLSATRERIAHGRSHVNDSEALRGTLDELCRMVAQHLVDEDER